MSEQALTLLKFGLLGLLYLFFVLALRAVWLEIRRPAGGDAAAPAAPAGPPPSLGQPVKSQKSKVPAPVAPALTGATGSDQRPSAAPATVESGGSDQRAESLAPGALKVVAPASMAGRIYRLEREITVGRAPGCGIGIDDTFVSTIHARVYAADPYWMVEDLGSTNGTLFNGAKLEAPQVIRPGDQIQLGSTILELQ